MPQRRSRHYLERVARRCDQLLDMGRPGLGKSQSNVTRWTILYKPCEQNGILERQRLSKRPQARQCNASQMQDGADELGCSLYARKQNISLLNDPMSNLDKAIPASSTPQDTSASNYTASSIDDTVYHSATTILLVAMNNQSSSSPLRNGATIDTASHIQDRFESIGPCHEELSTDDHHTIIRGYRRMHLHLNIDRCKEVLRAYAALLRDSACIPGFHTNPISARFLHENLMFVSINIHSEESQIGPERATAQARHILHRV